MYSILYTLLRHPTEIITGLLRVNAVGAFRTGRRQPATTSQPASFVSSFLLHLQTVDEPALLCGLGLYGLHRHSLHHRRRLLDTLCKLRFSESG
jgi:hypothetical protein